MCSQWAEAIGAIFLSFLTLALLLGVLPISIVYFANKVLHKDRR